MRIYEMNKAEDSPFQRTNEISFKISSSKVTYNVIIVRKTKEVRGHKGRQITLQLDYYIIF